MSGIGGPNIIEDGLVLYLDAGNRKSYPGSGTTWFDKSGGGNNGTLINGPTFNTGSLGSIVFDKIDDYINVNIQIQFDRLNPFTLGAWVNTNDGNNNQIINNETVEYRGYQFAIDINGKLFFFLRNTVSTNFLGVRMLSNFPLNLWCYVTAVYNGSSNASGVKLYINGIEQITEIAGDNLTSTTISNQTTWIGRRRPITQGPFNGKISIVQIYNRALSAQEVLQNYNATKGRFGL
jgi:hypothetical protein